MAMTKRVRVSFDAKIVCSTEDEAAVAEKLLKMSKHAYEGNHLDGLSASFVKAALQGGVNQALEVAIKKTVKDSVVAALEDEYTVSNFRFEVKR